MSEAANPPSVPASAPADNHGADGGVAESDSLSLEKIGEAVKQAEAEATAGDVGPADAAGVASSVGAAEEADETSAGDTAVEGGNLVLSDGTPRPLTHMQECDARLASGTMPEVSQRFLNADKGNVTKANTRWNKTLTWRRDMGISSILRRPHPNFAVIKQFFPHWYHLPGKNGDTVYFEKSGAIDLRNLKTHGIGINELLYHYQFITEYLWTYLSPLEESRSITVLDVRGIGMKDVGGDVLKFIKAAIGFSGQHYPERCGQIYIINVPMWFSGIWKMIKPWIDPVTVARTHIVRGEAKITAALLEHIDAAHLPTEYGGQSTVALGQSAAEQTLAELVQRLNA